MVEELNKAIPRVRTKETHVEQNEVLQVRVEREVVAGGFGAPAAREHVVPTPEEAHARHLLEHLLHLDVGSSGTARSRRRELVRAARGRRRRSGLRDAGTGGLLESALLSSGAAACATLVRRVPTRAHLAAHRAQPPPRGLHELAPVHVVRHADHHAARHVNVLQRKRQRLQLVPDLLIEPSRHKSKPAVFN